MKSTLLLMLMVSSCTLTAQQINQQSFNAVNTQYDEQSPVISPDGKLLFFTISNHPQNIGAKRDPGDIWFSVWVGDQWSAPVHAGPLLNDGGYNAVGGISADGKQLTLLSHYSGTEKSAQTQGIAISRNTGNGWGKPQNILIPYFQNKSSILSGQLSNDGSAFVFSADTYGSRGAEDLYVSLKKEDGSWSESRNLGDVINTKLQELSPSLSADNQTLYFSSNGKKGYGSFDVYFSTRLDDTWRNWSEPINFGGNVNSEGRELFFKNYPEAGISIYTSTKNSDGYGDVKVYPMAKPLKDSVVVAESIPITAEVKIEELKREVTADNTIKVHGTITNSNTGEVVNAKLIFESNGSKVSAQTSSGDYAVVVSSTKAYSIEIDAPGFVNHLEKLDVNTYEMKDLEMNFKLQPIEVGTIVTLKNILFIQSKPELLPQSYAELNVVIQFMKANPNVEIELSGHTDSRGSFRQLMTLSQQRVNRVKSYMVSKGIASKRIDGRGYGGSKPIASNDTEETRMLNRRVEFMIKKM